MFQFGMCGHVLATIPFMITNQRQSKQSPVEELLRQADSLIATQKPRAEVYAAMADSLGQTWKDLNAILEDRRIVLELAFNCHK